MSQCLRIFKIWKEFNLFIYGGERERELKRWEGGWNSSYASKFPYLSARHFLRNVTPVIIVFVFARTSRRARALIARTRNKGIRIRVLRRTLLHPTLTMNNCTLAGVHLLNEISHADM